MIALITLLLFVPELRADPEEFLLVSLSGEETAALIDANSFETIKLLPVAFGPHEITISPDRRTAYVAISGAGPSNAKPGKSVAAINLKDRSVRMFEKGMCEQPHDVRVSRDNKLLWVACAPAKSVLEFDTQSEELRKTWHTNVDGGWFVEVTPDDRKLLVPHLEGKSLSIINRETGELKNIAFEGSLGGIDISPDGLEAWMTVSEKKESLTVAIVNTKSDTVIEKFDVSGPGFGRLVFTPDGKNVIAANGKEAIIIDSVARKVTSRITLPAAAKVLTLSADGEKAFLTSPPTNQVIVLDLKNGKVETSFPTGKQPDGIAWIQGES
jgi:DNA-binding beta-propeller fold protein YncE